MRMDIKLQESKQTIVLEMLLLSSNDKHNNYGMLKKRNVFFRGI